ncbi:hypothetical protein BD289DRAFT_435803 [Coniella lustricola]|uniref:Tubby C-terminal-like domain-containing protein n=1 Tax=Coniella lustricola TaxID=2025994 RepID=A0A2T3A608_9PEZI|nr:hypothetical protein BD289DRAFT_435803 [Coniella lustricola]
MFQYNHHNNVTTTTNQFPPFFNVYRDGWGSKRYLLGPQSSKSAALYAVSLHSALSSQPSIVLHAGPTTSSPSLAGAKMGTFGRKTVVSLPPSPGPSWTSSEEEAHWNRGAGLYSHHPLIFSIEVRSSDGQLRREEFEWRRSSGDVVAALGGRSVGYKLVRCTSVGTMGPTSSDGKEIVAVWALHGIRLHQGFRFQFLGSGVDGALGERWSTMAVMTALYMWCYLRRASGNAAI